jgi:hypothetical protein
MSSTVVGIAQGQLQLIRAGVIAFSSLVTKGERLKGVLKNEDFR